MIVQNYFYVFNFGDVFEIDVLVYLFDLLGIVDDLLYK